MELLTVSGLTKNIGKKTVLANVSFSLQKQGIMAVFGPNGAGKTTLFAILAGLRCFNKGNICFNNKPIKKPGFFQANGIRYLPETPSLEPHLSGLEHLHFFASL